MHSPLAHAAKRYSSLVLLALSFLYAYRLLRIGIVNFKFDDALMFVRYAQNIRHRYGVAWNPRGAHVFGPTSLIWLTVAWLGTFVPLSPVSYMVAASWCFGIASLWSLSFSAWPHGTRRWSAAGWSWTLLLSVPLLMNDHFTVSMTNGMETMLALLLMSCFVAAVLRSGGAPSKANILWLANLAFLIVLTRPESLIAVVVLPIGVWTLHREWKQTLCRVGIFLGTLSVLVGLTLAVTKAYFGDALPLAFYCKSLRGYSGYRLLLNPFAYLSFFLEMALVPSFALLLCGRRRHIRMILPCGLALLLQVAYLSTVNQIMGWGGRYYIPYLPLITMPAIIVVSEHVRDKRRWSVTLSGQRVTLMLCALCFLNSQIMASVYGPLGRLLIRQRLIYQEPHFETNATVPLPEVEWWDACVAVAAIAAALPPGTEMSSSEVGLIGMMNPNVSIVDSSGLNDPRIAKGFSTDLIFQRKPDLIWLIHPDYTKAYGELSSDPRLLRDYILYAHAFNFGVAIRRDSSNRERLTDALRRAWERQYPGFELDDYQTTGVVWNSRPVIERGRTISVQP